MKTHVHALVAILVTPLALAAKDRTAQRLLNTQSDTSDTSVVGVVFPVTTSGDANDEMPPSLQEEVIEALETDDQVTVVGDIMVGVLSCESLEGAEDATELLVTASPGEVITAGLTSYTFISGNAFDDGIGRHVWVGEEVVDDIMDPQRTISITWGEECNIETFLLKMTTTEMEEEAISVVKSIPCIPGASTDLCIVETEVTPEEEEEPDPVSTDSSVRARNLIQTAGSRPGAAKFTAEMHGSSRDRRQLQSTTTIDVMYLYTEGGKSILGGISDTQMQTTIATGVVTTNQAMINSEIDLEISPVHIGLLPYDETSTTPATVLSNLESDQDVADLRDEYAADLVQLYTDLGSPCGRGNLFSGNATDAFSTVHPPCLDSFSHTHELGHNLGCYHNRENTIVQTEYAHGYRYCNTTDPYRTIMSYLCPNDFFLPRVNWFSNPDVVLYDKPTGTTDNDCARAIEENMVTISEFRSAIQTPVIVDNPCFNSSNTAEYRCGGKRNGRIIDLNRCDIIDTDADLLRSCFEVVDITNVRKIKLNVNSFTSLPFDLFDGMDSLTTLNLQRNCGLTCFPPVPTGTNVLLSDCNSDIGTCDA